MSEEKTALTEIARLLEEHAHMTKPFLTFKEAIVYLDMSESKLYKLTSAEKIPFNKKGGKLYFDRKILDEWVLNDNSTETQEIRQHAKSVFNKKRDLFKS